MGDNRTDEILVSPPPVSTRDHQPCQLAVSSVHSQLSRCRGPSRRARHHGFLRSDSSLVPEVWTSICSHSAAADKVGSVTSGMWTSCSSRSAANAIIFGERSRRAVDQDGDVLDILVTRHRDKRAAKRFFRRALKHQGRPPLQLVTDKLRSYPPAHREVFPSATHRTGQYENNRAEVSHQHTRERERQMRRFKSAAQVQRFLSFHGLIHNLFRVARHRLKAVHHRLLRERAFTDWRKAACDR